MLIARTRWYSIGITMAYTAFQEYCDENEISISPSSLLLFDATCVIFKFFLVSVSPSSRAPLSSSPCNSFLLSLCSPYDQVFFMLCLQSVVWIGPILLFRLARLHPSLPFNALSLAVCPLSRLDNGKHVYVKRAPLFMVNSRSQCKALCTRQYRGPIWHITLFTRAITLGSQHENDCDILHFSSLSKSVVCVWKRMRLLWFIPYYLWLLDYCCSFDVIFHCKHPFF